MMLAKVNIRDRSIGTAPVVVMAHQRKGEASLVVVWTAMRRVSVRSNIGSYNYWSCSEYSTAYAWFQYWASGDPGGQDYYGKTAAYYVRAVRRSVL